MIFLFIADGFEDIEAIGTADILRRCGHEVQFVSITGKRVVTSAHGVVIKADSIFRKNHIIKPEALIFPGGLKSAETMKNNNVLRLTIQQQAYQHTLMAAICAAPMILGNAGVLRGFHATIYPGMEEHIDGAIYHSNARVVEHENFITANGPGATRHFAFVIARRLAKNPEKVDEVERAMVYTSPDVKMETYMKF